MFETYEKLIEAHGDVELKFRSYYKYSFTFAGVTSDGKVIRASIGGDSGDIYKMEVVADRVERLRDLTPCEYVSIDEKEVFHGY